MDLTYADAALMITAIASVVGAIVSIFNMRRIQEVHLSLNSRLDAFLMSTHAEGVAEGRETERNKSDSDSAS